MGRTSLVKIRQTKTTRKIIFNDPIQIARCVGEEQEWIKVTKRYEVLINKWPNLKTILPKYFKVLNEYEEQDFIRLFTVLEWLTTHPDSNLYIRQLPINDVHTKWLLSRKAVIADFIKSITNNDINDFYQITGLRKEPTLIRIRILDEESRKQVNGIGDLSISLEYLKTLILPIKRVYIVENLQTGFGF